MGWENSLTLMITSFLTNGAFIILATGNVRGNESFIFIDFEWRIISFVGSQQQVILTIYLAWDR